MLRLDGLDPAGLRVVEQCDRLPVVDDLADVASRTSSCARRGTMHVPIAGVGTSWIGGSRWFGAVLGPREPQNPDRAPIGASACAVVGQLLDHGTTLQPSHSSFQRAQTERAESRAQPQ